MKIRLLLFLLAGLIAKADVMDRLVVRQSGNITNVTAVNLTGSLTNVSIYGGTVIDTGDELQDTVDYSLALTPNGNTTTENDASPRPRSVATIASLVSDVDPLLVPSYARISVLGYSAAGDGGGGDFRRVLASSGTTNLGTFFKSTANALYAWRRVAESGSVNVAWFGAKPDDDVDDTTAFQSAIDYAEDSNGGRVFVPPGVWDIDSISIDSCEFYGVRPQQERTAGVFGTILKHATNATGPMIVISGAALVKPNIHDISQVGGGNTYKTGKVAITSVTSRLQFAVASSNAPTLATVTGYPPQVALFYTSDDYYLGSAFVTSITNSGGSCEIVLDGEMDNYASPSGASELLTTSCKVLFSPLVTVGASTYPNPSGAGYPAIYYSKPLGARIADVTITKFHAGIVIATTDSTPMLSLAGVIKINNCEFAGLAGETHTSNIDCSSTGIIWVSGGYIWPYGYLGTYHNPNSVGYSLARNTSFAFWNPWSFSTINQAHSDMAVVAYYSAREIASSVTHFLADNAVRHGVVSENGRFDTVGGTGLKIGTLIARGWLSNTNTTSAFFTNKSAVRVTGTTIANHLAIETLAVPAYSGYENFEFAFDISGAAHLVEVGSKLGTLSGADSLYRSTAIPVRWASPWANTSASQAVSGWYAPAATAQTFATSGTNVLSLSGSGVSATLPLTATVSATVGPVSSTEAWRVQAANSTNIVRVDTTNGRTYVVGPSGEGSDPTFNTGTALVVKNNSQTTDRSRIVVVGGSSGFSTIEFGPTLSESIQVDHSNDRLNVNQQGVNVARWKTRLLSLSDTGSITDADNSALLDLQSTTRGLLIPRLTATPGSPADGLIWYRSDTDVLALRANGATVNVATAPGVGTLSYSGSDVTVTAGKGPLQEDTLTATGNFNLLFTGLASRDAGTIFVWPAATNCTVTLPSYAKGPAGSTLTIEGGTGYTNHTEIAWKNLVVDGTNRVSINALNYY